MEIWIKHGDNQWLFNVDMDKGPVKLEIEGDILHVTTARAIHSMAKGGGRTP